MLTQNYENAALRKSTLYVCLTQTPNVEFLRSWFRCTAVTVWLINSVMIIITVSTHIATIDHRHHRPHTHLRDESPLPSPSSLLQEGIRNRTEPAEPNWTKPFNSGTGRNRTRKRTEPNRTESRRVRKVQAEPRWTGKMQFLNRTEPINFRKGRNRNESNRTGSFPLLRVPCAQQPQPTPRSCG